MDGVSLSPLSPKERVPAKSRRQGKGCLGRFFPGLAGRARRKIDRPRAWRAIVGAVALQQRIPLEQLDRA